MYNYNMNFELKGVMKVSGGSKPSKVMGNNGRNENSINGGKLR